MRIILEGVDAAGKSMLAAHLIKKYDYSMVHSGSSAPNTVDYYLGLLSNLDHVILDRAHISEAVFQKLYDRPERLSFDDINTINAKIVENNDVLILMYSSDLDILRKRFIDRNEPEYLDEVEDQYKEFLKWAYILDAYFDDYPYFKIVDISQPNAYEKLYNWIDEVVENNAKFIYYNY